MHTPDAPPATPRDEEDRAIEVALENERRLEQALGMLVAIDLCGLEVPAATSTDA